VARGLARLRPCALSISPLWGEGRATSISRRRHGADRAQNVRLNGIDRRVQRPSCWLRPTSAVADGAVAPTPPARRGAEPAPGRRSRSLPRNWGSGPGSRRFPSYSRRYRSTDAWFVLPRGSSKNPMIILNVRERQGLIYGIYSVRPHAGIAPQNRYRALGWNASRRLRAVDAPLRAPLINLRFLPQHSIHFVYYNPKT
jgi:hypothetical protein